MQEAASLIQSYLVFRVSGELFASSVVYVQEILEVPRITKIPQAPRYMRGVINLRGNVLPVVDAAIKFGLNEEQKTVDSCILVLTFENGKQNASIGTLVDAVTEVVDINTAEIQPAPSIGARYKAEFVEGMIKINDRFVMLLDVNRVFNSDAEITLQQESVVAITTETV